MKKQLRKSIIKSRAALSFKQQSQAAETIYENLVNNLNCQQAKSIALYSAHNNELSVERFFHHCLQNNKQCYFPIIKGCNMFFKQACFDSQWAYNKFGILEPLGSDCRNINNLDCIIMPCIGVDSNGFRLGYGKGFYDRTIKDAKCWKIIVAYKMQLCDSIYPDSWDVAADEVLLV